MALILPSSLIADIRGSVGDVIFLRGPGGAAVRDRAPVDQTPTGPRTDCIETMQLIAPTWSDGVSEQQRTDWRRYAKTWPRPNRLGGGTHGSGFNCFTRHNWYLARDQQVVYYLDPPPSGPIPPPTIHATFLNDGEYLRITLPIANYTPEPPSLAVYISLGIECNLGRNFYASPWRYVGRNLYYMGGWSHNPWDLTPPFPIAQAKRIFGYAVAQHDATGELSTPCRFQADNP